MMIRYFSIGVAVSGLLAFPLVSSANANDLYVSKGAAPSTNLYVTPKRSTNTPSSSTQTGRQPNLYVTPRRSDNLSGKRAGEGEAPTLYNQHYTKGAEYAGNRGYGQRVITPKTQRERDFLARRQANVDVALRESRQMERSIESRLAAAKIARAAEQAQVNAQDKALREQELQEKMLKQQQDQGASQNNNGDGTQVYQKGRRTATPGRIFNLQ